MKPSQDQLESLSMLRLNASRCSAQKEPFETSMPEADDHYNQCNPSSIRLQV
jgi:hypothetical protein